MLRKFVAAFIACCTYFQFIVATYIPGINLIIFIYLHTSAIVPGSYFEGVYFSLTDTQSMVHTGSQAIGIVCAQVLPTFLTTACREGKATPMA